MPRTGRPKSELVLTDEERKQLTKWAWRAKSSQALALRSRIVLGCGGGLDSKSVAEGVGCSANTVEQVEDVVVRRPRRPLLLSSPSTQPGKILKPMPDKTTPDATPSQWLALFSTHDQRFFRSSRSRPTPT